MRKSGCKGTNFFLTVQIYQQLFSLDYLILTVSISHVAAVLDVLV